MKYVITDHLGNNPRFLNVKEMKAKDKYSENGFSRIWSPTIFTSENEAKKILNQIKHGYINLINDKLLNKIPKSYWYRNVLKNNL